VAQPREPPNVVLEGLTQLLPVTLHIPRVAQSHVYDLEVADEDLSYRSCFWASGPLSAGLGAACT
jgi:hypothetical protein